MGNFDVLESRRGFPKDRAEDFPEIHPLPGAFRGRARTRWRRRRLASRCPAARMARIRGSGVPLRARGSSPRVSRVASRRVARRVVCWEKRETWREKRRALHRRPRLSGLSGRSPTAPPSLARIARAADPLASSPPPRRRPPAPRSATWRRSSSRGSARRARAPIPRPRISRRPPTIARARRGPRTWPRCSPASTRRSAP